MRSRSLFGARPFREPPCCLGMDELESLSSHSVSSYNISLSRKSPSAVRFRSRRSSSLSSSSHMRLIVQRRMHTGMRVVGCQCELRKHKYYAHCKVSVHTLPHEHTHAQTPTHTHTHTHSTETPLELR